MKNIHFIGCCRCQMILFSLTFSTWLPIVANVTHMARRRRPASVVTLPRDCEGLHNRLQHLLGCRPVL